VRAAAHKPFGHFVETFGSEGSCLVVLFKLVAFFARIYTALRRSALLNGVASDVTRRSHT
jgi:hypothetical protein